MATKPADELTTEEIRLLEELAEEKDGGQAAAIRAYIRGVEVAE